MPTDELGWTPARDLARLLPTYAFNFGGYPAISVPAGFTVEGLPVGLQIVGGWRQDARVLSAAAAFGFGISAVERRTMLSSPPMSESR